MGLRDELETGHAPRRARAQHPKGWEPGVLVTADELVFAGTGDNPAQFDALLEGEGVDPSGWEMVGELEFRKWQQRPGDEWCRYWRLRARPRRGRAFDLDPLLERVRRRRPRRRPTTPDGGHALVVALADWQTGSGHGGGPDALVERVERLADDVETRWRDLRRIGVPLDRLHVLGMGDMLEGCHGWYPGQRFQVVLNHEQQRSLTVELLDMLVDRWSAFAPEVHLRPVPGNHGEHREEGREITDPSDNADVGVFLDLARAHRKAPERYGHVHTHLPSGTDLTATFDVDGFVVGMAHGHQAARGAKPADKLLQWWGSNQFGRTPVGDADLLVTAHYHHPQIIDQGGRTLLMAPALCGHQVWWVNATGLDSRPSTVTFTVSGDGWDHVRYL